MRREDWINKSHHGENFFCGQALICTKELKTDSITIQKDMVINIDKKIGYKNRKDFSMYVKTPTTIIDVGVINLITLKENFKPSPLKTDIFW